MKNSELIKLLKTKGYKRVTLETDNGEPNTFYSYRRGLHVNATGNLSFHIVPPSQSLGLGRFAVCAVRDGGGLPDRDGLPGTVFPAPAVLPARRDKRGGDDTGYCPVNREDGLTRDCSRHKNGDRPPMIHKDMGCIFYFPPCKGSPVPRVPCKVRPLRGWPKENHPRRGCGIFFRQTLPGTGKGQSGRREIKNTGSRSRACLTDKI